MNEKLKLITISLEPHKNIGQIIDTIAHEISHIVQKEHGKYHTMLKMKIKKVLKLRIEVYYE
jgi:hypothetical protein